MSVAPNMTALVLTVAFDGGKYSGYQAQNNADTVQKRLNEASAELFGFECAVTGCSRTDAGVHAYGFVVRVTPKNDSDLCENWWRVPKERLPAAMNRLLPEDIAVRGVFFADVNFHPRYDVLFKEYIYKIDDSGLRDPFNVGRVYCVKYRFSESDIINMNEAASYFKGDHDFRAFMASGSSVSDTNRTVLAAQVIRTNDNIIEFTVSANGFLYNMVRIMTGTLIDVGRGKIVPSDISGIIASCDRKNASATVPAYGLYMNRAVYPNGLLFK